MSGLVYRAGNVKLMLDTNIQVYITKTGPYNVDPLKPHFYTVKLGFTGVYIIFLISVRKYKLWYSLEPPQGYSLEPPP